MKKITSLILALVLAFSLVSLSACGDKATDDKKSDSADDKVITVGASATPHAEILEQVKQALADEGYELKIVTYDDYVLPNQALADGTLDANYFQHIPYMEQFNEALLNYYNTAEAEPLKTFLYENAIQGLNL